MEENHGNFDAALTRAPLWRRAAGAHVEQFMVEKNLAAIPVYFDQSPATRSVMERLLELLGCQLLCENSGDLVGAATDCGWTVEVITLKLLEFLNCCLKSALMLFHCVMLLVFLIHS